MSLTLPVPVNAQDWKRGRDDAPVTLVVYCDFQCGDCLAANREIAPFLAENAENVCYVFRHLPLTDVHVHALDAAKAAEAAGSLGKFWEMHDTLFSDDAVLTVEGLQAAAARIGLEPDAFTQALADEKTYRGVRADVDGLRPTGLNNTPTVFLNGTRYEQPVTAEALTAAIASLSS